MISLAKIKEAHFIDEYHVKEAMMESNRWLKKRVITND